MKRTSGSIVAGLLILTGLSAAMYIYQPVSFREIATIEGFVSYARSFGSVMPLAAFLITMLQAVVPAVPFVILCSANGILLGLANGVILTWVGTLTGASLAFWGARSLGYEWAARRYGRAGLQKVDQLNGFRGFMIILALRLLPYFPAPLINISAGVSRINFLWFLLASAIGKLPFIIGYTLMGYSLLHAKNYALGISIMVVLIVIPYVIVKKTGRKATIHGKQQ